MSDETSRAEPVEVEILVSPAQYDAFAADLELLRAAAGESNTEVVVNAVRERAARVVAGPERLGESPLHFFTPIELPAHLSLPERTVRGLLAAGEIPSYRIGGSRRIDPDDVEKFLAGRREGRS